MKKLLIYFVIAFAFTARLAFAEPFLACDPQEDVTGYTLEFPAIPLTLNLTAEPDGSLKYDLGTWTYGTGWFDGTAKATDSYIVIDETTGNESSVAVESGGAPFKLKIPRGNSQNWIVK